MQISTVFHINSKILESRIALWFLRGSTDPRWGGLVLKSLSTSLLVLFLSFTHPERRELVWDVQAKVYCYSPWICAEWQRGKNAQLPHIVWENILIQTELEFLFYVCVHVFWDVWTFEGRQASMRNWILPRWRYGCLQEVGAGVRILVLTGWRNGLSVKG